MTIQLVDSRTGEALDATIIERRQDMTATDLAEALDVARRGAEEASFIRRELEREVSRRAPPSEDARTNRLLADGWEIEVYHGPAKAFAPARLRSIWSDARFARVRDKVLKVRDVAVDVRAWKKYRDAAGEGELAELIEAVKGAEEEGKQRPRVTLIPLDEGGTTDA